mmetsp:Transcript_9298/g.27948  ORF Transcript_9298/g.27948 Transcript_9298/m.27948 type:complete len:220 (-) Transcript_9298:649-1308(-)
MLNSCTLTPARMARTLVISASSLGRLATTPSGVSSSSDSDASTGSAVFFPFLAGVFLAALVAAFFAFFCCFLSSFFFFLAGVSSATSCSSPSPSSSSPLSPSAARFRLPEVFLAAFFAEPVFFFAALSARLFLSLAVGASSHDITRSTLAIFFPSSPEPRGSSKTSSNRCSMSILSLSNFAVALLRSASFESVSQVNPEKSNTFRFLALSWPLRLNITV